MARWLLAAVRATAVVVGVGLTASPAASPAGSEASARARCSRPSARSNHAMVYDEARDVVLLFGGLGGGGGR
jgi:hypothetical protein